MNRRIFSVSAIAALANYRIANAGLPQSNKQQQPSKAEADRSMQRAMSGPRLQIAMLLYPRFAAQDLIGAHLSLASLMNTDCHLVWKDKNPVPFEPGGAAMLPTRTLEQVPRDLDVLFVPGGLEGTIAVMKDDAVMNFLADRGLRARYVTSVCTGSIVLGCAGLLKGYRATSHWAFRGLLPLMGATRVDERVVEDRNRITGAGVTSGIDFGIALAARLRDRTYAEMIELANEYDPQPLFRAGTPEKAGAGLTAHLQEGFESGMTEMRRVLAKRLPRAS